MSLLHVCPDQRRMAQPTQPDFQLACFVKHGVVASWSEWSFFQLHTPDIGHNMHVDVNTWILNIFYIFLYNDGMQRIPTAYHTKNDCLPCTINNHMHTCIFTLAGHILLLLHLGGITGTLWLDGETRKAMYRLVAPGFVPHLEGEVVPPLVQQRSTNSWTPVLKLTWCGIILWFCWIMNTVQLSISNITKSNDSSKNDWLATSHPFHLWHSCLVTLPKTCTAGSNSRSAEKAVGVQDY